MKPELLTTQELDKIRGHKLYRSDGTATIRVALPLEVRKDLKLFQVKNDLSVDEATVQILQAFFKQYPQ